MKLTRYVLSIALLAILSMAAFIASPLVSGSPPDTDTSAVQVDHTNFEVADVVVTAEPAAEATARSMSSIQDEALPCEEYRTTQAVYQPETMPRLVIGSRFKPPEYAGYEPDLNYESMSKVSPAIVLLS